MKRMTAAQSQRRKGGRAKGAIGWKEAEYDFLFDLISEFLPVGAKKWELVALAHAKRFPKNNRTADACKKKFNVFARCEKPTGTNLIPRLVHKA